MGNRVDPKKFFLTLDFSNSFTHDSQLCAFVVRELVIRDCNCAHLVAAAMRASLVTWRKRIP